MSHVGGGAQAEVRVDFRAMGSPCRILVQPGTASNAKAIDAAIAEVQRIERKYSRYLEDSVVSGINRAAGSARPLELDTETCDLIDFAVSAYAASDGAFDLTTGVLRRVWDFRTGRLPAMEALAELMPLVGWSRVSWERPALRLPRPGMELDFGGIGKEYAVDRAATLLAEAGVGAALVNLGGDLRAVGRREDGQPWHFGIAHPRLDEAVVASLPLREGALATSGDYERFFELEGRRYCHILDPRSGWPVQGWQSISVVAPACLAAGTIATIAMLMGERALPFLRSQGLPFLAIDAQGRITDESGPGA
ncbi:FAD:protein FMN transferase [Ideonella sp. YS5]|uniref:FAD:protein FMN transferase n=1 Tax=Ideonella sp. YS5 TaxID=3453714 RepID=UPI003EED54CF